MARHARQQRTCWSACCTLAASSRRAASLTDTKLVACTCASSLASFMHRHSSLSWHSRSSCWEAACRAGGPCVTTWQIPWSILVCVQSTCSFVHPFIRLLVWWPACSCACVCLISHKHCCNQAKGALARTALKMAREAKGKQGCLAWCSEQDVWEILAGPNSHENHHHVQSLMALGLHGLVCTIKGFCNKKPCKTA